MSTSSTTSTEVNSQNVRDLYSSLGDSHSEIKTSKSKDSSSGSSGPKSSGSSDPKSSGSSTYDVETQKDKESPSSIEGGQRFKANTRKNRRSIRRPAAGICLSVTIFLVILAVISIVSLCGIIIGYQNWNDDKACKIKQYPFPLSEWLVIFGSMGIVRNTMFVVGIVGTSLIFGDDEDDAAFIAGLVGCLTFVLWFIPELALWIIGIIIIDLSDDDCKKDHYAVWAMSLAYVILHGIFLLIRFIYGCGLSGVKE